MPSEKIWLFNTRPHNWRKCVDGPPRTTVHEPHIGHPWHGLNDNTSWAADQMAVGDIAIVRQSKHGVMGIWEIKDTAPVISQDHHEWPEKYDVFIYCRGLHRELEPPLDDTEFLHQHDYVRFNAGANKLADDDAEEFLTHLLNREDLSHPAASRVISELNNLGVDVSGLGRGETQSTSEVESAADPEERVIDLAPPERTETTVSRVIRNSQLVKDLKDRYDYRCQVCGDCRHRGSGQPYAEGHHLHPLGDTPPGADNGSNIIVLCPNHHADFDYGVIEIDPETLEISHAYEEQLNGRQLMLNDGHNLSSEHLEYHKDEISTV